MFFRTPRFIRRWIRRRMHPMNEQQAWTVREKLSMMYMFFAWNAFGFVMYQMYKGNKHWPVTYGVKTQEEQEIERPGIGWAQTLGIKKAQIYRLGKHGMSQGYEYDAIEAPEGKEGEELKQV